MSPPPADPAVEPGGDAPAGGGGAGDVRTENGTGEEQTVAPERDDRQVSWVDGGVAVGIAIFYISWVLSELFQIYDTA